MGESFKENEDHLLELLRGEQYNMPTNFICSTAFSHTVAYLVMYLKVTISEYLNITMVLNILNGTM